MIYTEKPKVFTPKYEIVNCLIEYQDKILLLLRKNNDKSISNYWLPGWKVEDKDKNINEAMLREIEEETGLQNLNIKHCRTVYINKPAYGYTYHLYYCLLGDDVNIKINPTEHKRYIWIHPLLALKEPLVEDLDICIKKFYNI